MEESLFTKIIARKIPAKIADEDDRHDRYPRHRARGAGASAGHPQETVATLNELTADGCLVVGEPSGGGAR